MEELKRIKNALKLEKMIWFGSRVRGEYTQFSDVDVVVDKRYEGVDFIKRPGKFRDEGFICGFRGFMLYSSRI